MEEKKTKEVKLNPSQKTEQPQKLSYEELNNACAEMSQQLQNQGAYIQKLHRQIHEMAGVLQTKRMDYLFKIVELSAKTQGWFDANLVQKCTDEIQESLFPPEEEKEDTKEEA